MTKQIFTSAQGQTVDLGTIKLRNETVRAVGNMNVNARGDVLDSNNQVIETKSRQVQKQNARLTNTVDIPVHTSTAAARRAQTSQSDNTDSQTASEPADIVFDPVPVDTSPTVAPESIATAPEPAADPVADPVVPLSVPSTGGGLAAAIARSKIIKQEKEKTARQLAQSNPGVRKI